MRVRVKSAWIAAALAVACVTVLAGTKSTSSWTDPNGQPGTYRKVLVLAKITDDIARRVLEDAVVKGLKDSGVDALAAYQSLTEADLESSETIRAKAKELGVDAGIVYTVTGTQTQVKPSASVSVGVGVGGGGGGPFGFFLGASKPLGGGTTTVQQTGVKAEFYGSEVGKPLWIGNFTTDLKSGAEREAASIASLTLKQLKKAKILKKA